MISSVNTLLRPIKPSLILILEYRLWRKVYRLAGIGWTKTIHYCIFVVLEAMNQLDAEHLCGGLCEIDEDAGNYSDNHH
jgi:hypothetical protein